MEYAYLFEAKGIQKYILESGRLADLIGASDLVAGLTRSDEDDLLERVLETTRSKVNIARRAGGSFCLISSDRESLARVRALWRLTVGTLVQGMSFTDCAPVEAGGELTAMRAAYGVQSGGRENESAFLLPIGGPLTEFNPRTGRPASVRLKLGNEVLAVDVVAQSQRARGAELANTGDVDRLARSFLPVDDTIAANYLFPRHFEPRDATRSNPAFPFGAGTTRDGPVDTRVAIVHADISGLGQLFRKISLEASSVKDVRSVAEAIESAVVRAARRASEECLLPFAAAPGDQGYERLFGPRDHQNPQRKFVVPARPIVLGGDDITVLTRADLSVRFAERLLAAIETETALAFAALNVNGLPEHGLSACAGVAVVGSGHPFLAAHTMAEGLCAAAKLVAKEGGTSPFPSYLAFAVVTSTIDEAFDGYREREQVTASGDLLNGGPYLVANDKVLGSTVGNIRALAAALTEGSGHGKLIEALGLLHEHPTSAIVSWARYWEVLKDNEESFDRVIHALERCLGVAQPEAGTASIPDLKSALPFLNDALELVDIGVEVAP